MTWKINTETGELIDPNGNVVANLGEPPYKAPDDAQKWAEQEFRSMTMAEIDTDTLADFAQLWTGDVVFTNTTES
jgi:hypothetical protein